MSLSHVSRIAQMRAALRPWSIVSLCLVAIMSTGQCADFESTAGSVLSKRCIECHNRLEASGDLDLTRGDRILVGGDSGAAIVPGRSGNSLLMERVVAGEMPPEKNGKSQALTAEEIQSLRDWVDQGAEWPQGRVLDLYDRTSEVRAGRDWWSLQPVQAPEIPKDGETKLNNPIDAFVRAKLRDNGLSPAHTADKRTLIRRVYYDLIGLPPTADDIDAFVSSDMPDAYEAIVDRLLASPQYGERWARHWLDVVRYADTNGYERDAEKPHAWRYRDWVVRAFNEDMPYDRFVQEQLSGDELPDRTESTVIATGFIRLGTWDDEPNDVAEYQYERLEDMVHATSTAFLGLTVKCARCHDHKFDPIYQSDYYRLGAAFWPGPVAHRDRTFNGGPTPDELGFDVLGWTDIASSPAPLFSLKKGDIHRPIQAVEAGPLSAIVALDQPFEPAPAQSKTTGRRLQLAQWITHPNNPLTTRVIVNRLWQHHFGQGLVSSSDNFGFNGKPPTHPELLDWLANDLVVGQWKLKRLQKLMVTSETYMQSSNHPNLVDYDKIDASNDFLWRANRQRLDAEALRDSILFASGKLDLRLGGPSFRAAINSEALEGLSMKGGAYQASPASETSRRSLYLYNKRGLMVPMMTTFDICDSTMPTGRRDSTIVAPQALAMLNNDWVHEQSRQLAARVVATSASTDERIAQAWRFVLGRSPRQAELDAAREHVTKQQNTQAASRGDSEQLGWISLCHVLLNTNEFIYVD